MANRLEERRNTGNRGFAKGGSYIRYERRREFLLKILKVTGIALAVAAISVLTVVFVFGVRAVLGVFKDTTPKRITIRYSEEISERLDRNEAYKDGVLYVDFDTVADVLGLSQSKFDNEVTYYTKNGDSLVLTVGSNTVFVNSVPCSAAGIPYFDENGRLRAPADIVNMYVNETAITVGDSGKAATLVTVSDGSGDVSFNLKKSELLDSLGRPIPMPGETKYDPTGTLPPINIPGRDPSITLPPLNEDTEEVIAGYEFKTDISAYKKYLNPENRAEYLVLANRSNPLGKDYTPTGLVDVNEKYVMSGKDYKLREAAAKALEAMILEMKAENVWDTEVCSAYRSYEYQENLYNRYVQEEKDRDPSLTDDEAKKLVDRYSSLPGTSDHQTGLCVDFYELDESFMERKAYKWLVENAHKFGFIMRFPEGKTDITGYIFEPWHWRFVGQNAAYEIKSRGLTLEEYLGKIN